MLCATVVVVKDLMSDEGRRRLIPCYCQVSPPKHALQESMRIKPVVATGTIRIARTKATTLDNGRLHIPPMCSFWTASHTMHNSTYNWGPDAREYKPVRPHDVICSLVILLAPQTNQRPLRPPCAHCTTWAARCWGRAPLLMTWYHPLRHVPTLRS